MINNCGALVQWKNRAFCLKYRFESYVLRQFLNMSFTDIKGYNMSFTDIKGYDRKQHLDTKLCYGNDQNFITFVECLDDNCPNAFELQFTDGVAGITICYKKTRIVNNTQVC